jgi:putative ABC transport system substrate-binding protein
VNFDRTLIPQLLTNAASKKPAMIVAVTTPVAQSSIRVVTDKSVPIVFMSVVDPVVAQIVPSWQAGSATHTGATLYPDFAASLRFLKTLMPNAKRIGVPYNPPRTTTRPTSPRCGRPRRSSDSRSSSSASTRRTTSPSA